MNRRLERAICGPVTRASGISLLAILALNLVVAAADDTASLTNYPGSKVGPEPPPFLPTPKSVTMEKGTMPLTSSSRIVYTVPRLQPLAAILSDEILLITDLKLSPSSSAPKPGDIVLKINPELRADADIVAAQRKAPDKPEVREWKSKKGDTVEARFVKLDKDKVTLFRPATSNSVVVALGVLSDEDQALVKSLGSPVKEVVKIVRTRDFAHTIEVAEQATVEGWDYRAVAEGTATLLQAIDRLQGKDGKGRKCYLPRMKIKDWPHADYTGTMIDAARQWIPPDCIKFTIEACRFWKIRYLQMHFSDDHAYTFGSKIFPELGNKNQQISEGIVSRCYTQEEMKDLEAYAVARGVTIVPELETPGHHGAMARSRPELFNGPGCMPMASDKLYEALDKLVGEMCSIFKTSPYFHIGCDECNYSGVGNSPEEKAYMKKHTLPLDDHPLNDGWQVFIMHIIRMKQICGKYGKIAVAWEGLAADKRVKDDIVVMTWYNPGFANDMESQGFSVITVPWGVPKESFPAWNMYNANGHVYKRESNVLGAQRPMWQMSEFSMYSSYVPVLCEREERTWGPDTPMPDENEYRARMAKSTERMLNVAAPVKVETEGGKVLGVADGLKGWIGFSGVLTVKLTAPFPKRGEIRYTLDGSDPTAKSSLYTRPLTMRDPFTLKAALFYDKRQMGSARSVRYVK